MHGCDALLPWLVILVHALNDENAANDALMTITVHLTAICEENKGR